MKVWRSGLAILLVAIFGLMGCAKKEEPKVTAIKVTIRPQAGTGVDVNNARVQIYSDAQFQNLVTEGAATGSSVEASVTLEVSPGTYYVVAWKDVNSNGTLDAGDFYGFYANDLGQPLGVTLSEGETVSIEFVVSVYSGGGGGGTTGTIQGTATLAQGLTGDLGGAVASIYTSYDNWYNDNYLERIPVSGNGATVTFTFSNVDPGTYYLDVWKDNDNSGTWNSGDFAGVYDEDGDGNIDPLQVDAGETVQVTITVFQLQ